MDVVVINYVARSINPLIVNTIQNKWECSETSRRLSEWVNQNQWVFPFLFALCSLGFHQYAKVYNLDRSEMDNLAQWILISVDIIVEYTYIFGLLCLPSIKKCYNQCSIWGKQVASFLFWILWPEDLFLRIQITVVVIIVAWAWQFRPSKKTWHLCLVFRFVATILFCITSSIYHYGLIGLVIYIIMLAIDVTQLLVCIYVADLIRKHFCCCGSSEFGWTLIFGFILSIPISYLELTVLLELPHDEVIQILLSCTCMVVGIELAEMYLVEQKDP